MTRDDRAPRRPARAATTGPGPRYTSYPTAVEFHDGVTDGRLRRAPGARRCACRDEPLSLYVHLPFCEERCAFCGCNVVITKHRDVADALPRLRSTREIDLLAAAPAPPAARCRRLHWGGGTPTYYTRRRSSSAVFARLARHFALTPDAEDRHRDRPARDLGRTARRRCARLGFNRLSMGVQDFTPEVQDAVNRVQSYEQTRGARRARARARLHLAQHRPHLRPALPDRRRLPAARSIRCSTLRPDRVAVYSFAFVPWMRAHMKQLPAEALPGPALKLALLARAQAAFGGAGYRQIGMDHFALPDDELARALEARVAASQLHGLHGAVGARHGGARRVGHRRRAGRASSRTPRSCPSTTTPLDAGRFPIERGYALDDDDVLRRSRDHRAHVQRPPRHRARSKRGSTSTSPDYFAAELAELTAPGSPAADGLVEVGADAIEVTPVGRLFVRNVCMVVRSLPARAHRQAPTPVFSRTV